ncbi:MAG: GMC family oxidoreductase N-terminal domain-containing protein, partial [Pseudanabaenaceae cyanobacterium]
GGGRGGAVTAQALAAAGREVLWLEEGPHWPLDSCAPFSRAELEQKYRCGGLTVTLSRPQIQYVEGRCVGGGSEVNSGLYHRLPEALRQAWEKAYALPAFTEKDLAPHFDHIERALSVSYGEGPPPPPAQKLALGAEALGLTAQAVPRWFRGDRKQSMTETLVPQALAAGAQLWANHRVQRLSRGQGRWEVQGQGQTLAAAHVFVCGGAIQTPALLQRSGFRGQIGRSLQMHPTVRAIAVFPEKVNHPGLGVAAYQVKASDRYRFGSSAATPGYVRLGLLDYPGAEVPWEHTAMYYVALAGGERGGTVQTLPGWHDPVVRYALTRRDRTELAQGLRQLCQLLLAAGAHTIYPGVGGWAPVQSPADLETWPEILPPTARTMTVHLFGSCPLGHAVDPWGQIAPGLYLNDSSLLPGALGVNPQGTLMALARRNVGHFLGEG